MRLMAILLVPALLFTLIEVTLRLSNYGYATTFFVSTGDGNSLTTNQKFAWQFYGPAKATAPTPTILTKTKEPGAARVFVLGESAAAGTPDPAFGFSRQLELMLRHRYPSQRLEVINAAMRGIDSYAIRQIAAECADLSPDVFVIYMGNNEMIGLHAPSPEGFQISANVHWLRFQHVLKRTKLVQLGESWMARAFKKGPAPEQDMEFFRRQRIALDDPRRDSVYKNFALNLRDICRSATSAGAKAIVCTVGANLRDFPPLGSLHRTGLSPIQAKEWEQSFDAGKEAEARHQFAAALDHYAKAARIDDHFAELHFRLARCAEAVGKMDDAKRHYVLARDWDTIQFRTDSRLNEAVRAVAKSAGADVRLLDIENKLPSSLWAEKGIPGGRLFHEHVHLKFEGDYQVATWLLPEVSSALRLSSAVQPPLTLEECARRLAYTSLEEGNMKIAIARLTASPPFLDQVDHAIRQAAANDEIQKTMGNVSRERIDDALATYAAALRARPHDWMLHFNLGNLLSQLGQHRDAAAEFAKVVILVPGHRNLHVAYGNALLQAGQRQEAGQQFAAALKVDANYLPAQQGLKLVRGER